MLPQAHRRDDDIAIVNAGLRLRLAPSPDGAWVVEEAALALGGVAPRTISAPAVAAALVGRPLDRAAVAAALAALPSDVDIAPDAPGGMVEYRRALAASFLFKGLLWAAAELQAEAGVAPDFPAEQLRSAAAPYSRPPTRGLQYFSQASGSTLLAAVGGGRGLGLLLPLSSPVTTFPWTALAFSHILTPMLLLHPCRRPWTRWWASRTHTCRRGSRPAARRSTPTTCAHRPAACMRCWC